MGFFPSSSAYTRSAEKPGLRLSKWGKRCVQEATLTCKAEELDQVKGIEHVLANLATAECQLSDFKVLIECARTPVMRGEDQRMSRMIEHLSIAHHEAINRHQNKNEQ